jgi:dienelactone hydrolase
MGLIASMAPIKPPADRGYVWAPRADLFRLSVKVGGRIVASTSFRRSWGKPFSVRRETVRSSGFVGTFFSPSGAGRKTAVLTLGGGEGGNRTQLLAARFAADGYPALALAYFQAPGLPHTLTNIRLEYFENALHWLMRQPQVDPQRLVVDGSSRGTQIALLLAVHYPKLVHGVIAVSPSNVVACGTHGRAGPKGCIGAAFTLDGHPVPYTRQWGDAYPTDTPAAVIPVERITAPLLLACAEDDSVWPSCESSHAIVQRLAARHSTIRRHLYSYLNGGHQIDVQLPYQPGTINFDSDIPQGEQTREHLWPHILAFLRSI